MKKRLEFEDWFVILFLSISIILFILVYIFHESEPEPKPSQTIILKIEIYKKLKWTNILHY